MGRGFGQRLLCPLLPTLSHAWPGAPLGVQTVAGSPSGGANSGQELLWGVQTPQTKAASSFV